MSSNLTPAVYLSYAFELAVRTFLSKFLAITFVAAWYFASHGFLGFLPNISAYVDFASLCSSTYSLTRGCDTKYTASYIGTPALTR